MTEANGSVLDVFAFLKDEFSRERESKFSLLKKVPDTLVLGFLDCFEGLTVSEQDEFAEAIAYRSLQFFFSKNEIVAAMPQTDDTAFQRHFPAMLHIAFNKYTSARELRLLATLSKSDELWKIIPKPPEEFLRYAASIGPVRAVEMRKQIKSAFGHRFGAKVSNSGGGVWLYECNFDDSTVEIEIDFGGRDQLRYEVTISSHSRQITLERLRYEVLLGAGLGDWNFLTEENLTQSLELLCEFVAYLITLPERLPVSYHHRQPLNFYGR